MTNPIKVNSSKAGNLAYVIATLNFLLFFLYFIVEFDSSSMLVDLALILCLIGGLFSFVLICIGSIAHSSKRSAEYLKMLVEEKE